MDKNDREELNNISEKVIGAAFEVSNEVGSGFLEKVYENALEKEISRRGLQVRSQVPLDVNYKGDVVGEFYADMIVENRVLIELKVVKNLDEIHFAQCLNYLRATDYELCLLINFYSPKVFVKRIINDY
jgi:GxxExxY protein